MKTSHKIKHKLSRDKIAGALEVRAVRDIFGETLSDDIVPEGSVGYVMRSLDNRGYRFADDDASQVYEVVWDIAKDPSKLRIFYHNINDIEPTGFYG